MENMGGKMKKILMLIFLLIQTFYYSQDFSNFGEVRINYGNKLMDLFQINKADWEHSNPV